jgi:hypothetical protein
MSGVNWETTPDGRPGWQMFFLRAGFDVYVSDAVERGRASWAPYPEVYAEVPYFRTAREAWEETFRFGPVGSWHRDPGARRTRPGVRFPVEFVAALGIDTRLRCVAVRRLMKSHAVRSHRLHSVSG